MELDVEVALLNLREELRMDCCDFDHGDPFLLAIFNQKSTVALF